MRRIVAAGRTDVGQVREGNEDALLIRDGLFAVADGMGGHQAGEVASATALEIVEGLDGHVFRDADAAVDALRNAVVQANETVSGLADNRPEYRGMGTTLTVAMVEGRRVHIAHVGDSRAYLLRDGQLEQITDDHTLVQHLVNEGQISRQEAETHPQRSIITRAIGVSSEVEVDTMTFDLRAGDQLLLCSDGLTGVLADAELAERLVTQDEAEATVQDLVDRANAGGGPDNITVVLLRYEEFDRDGGGPTLTRTSTPISIRSGSEGDAGAGDWAAGVGRYGDLSAGGDPQAQAGSEEEPRQVNAILGRASAIVLAVAVLVGLVVFGAQFLLSRSYFVALDEEQVVIYEGIDASIGPIELARVVERTELEVDDVQEWYRPTLESGRPATDLSDARNIVAGIPVRDDADADQDDLADIDEDSVEDEGDAAGSS